MTCEYIHDDLCDCRRKLEAERDGLKSRVERMEKALRDLMEVYRKNVVMEHSSQPTKNSDPEYFEAKSALEQGEGGVE